MRMPRNQSVWPDTGVLTSLVNLHWHPWTTAVMASTSEWRMMYSNQQGTFILFGRTELIFQKSDLLIIDRRILVSLAGLRLDLLRHCCRDR